MKRLLVLMLAANIACAESSFVTEVKEIASEVGEQLTEVFITTPAEMAKEGVTKVKDTAQTFATKVKDSDAYQDATDVVEQVFIGFPTQVGQNIKHGFDASIDAARRVRTKFVNSRFATKIKDANNKVVDTSKKAAAAIKNTAKDVAHNAVNNEFVEDGKDVLDQFADAPREAWANIAAFFTTVKSKII